MALNQRVLGSSPSASTTPSLSKPPNLLRPAVRLWLALTLSGVAAHC